jgi:hypothetical protein
MKTANASYKAIAILTFMFFVLMGYQNCAPVEFDHIDKTLSEKGQPDEDLIMEPVPDDEKDDIAEDDTKDDTKSDDDKKDDDKMADDDTKDKGKDKEVGKGKDKRSCQKTACGDFSDMELTVVALEINDSSGKIRLVPVEPLKVRSADLAAGLEFELDKSLRINQVRLVLAVDGNYLLDDEGVRAFTLKTPSGQQSGIKLQARAEATQAGVYKVRANVDLSKQIVRAGSKCIFKPVVKDASVVFMSMFEL